MHRGRISKLDRSRIWNEIMAAGMRQCLFRRLLLAILASIVPALPASPVNPQTLFDKIRQRVADSIHNAPSYTCVETVERSWFREKYDSRPVCDTDRPTEPQNLILLKRDRLRLDVGIVQRREVFSWHGENSFKTERIADLVTEGPINSGTFFSFLSGIFVTGRGRYFYHGLRAQGDDEAAAFEFRVPRGVSGFVIGTPNGYEVTAYQGTFSADPHSGELKNLQIWTNDLPPAIHACSLRLNAAYPQEKQNRAFSLPSDVEMDIAYQGDELVRTSTRYHNCHQFLGEATIHFDNKYQPSTISAPQIPVRELPAGLPVKIRLTSVIDSSSAWAGDAIAGTLATAIKSKKGKLLVDKGAKVTGRLLGCAHVLEPAGYWTAKLQFDTIHTPEANYRVTLDPKEHTDTPFRLHRNVTPSWIDSEAFSTRPRSGVGSFRFRGDKLRLDERFESEWITKRTKPQN
jgi:hypothetical protein